MKMHYLTLTGVALTLLTAGCGPAPSSSSAAPKAPGGVTSRTEQALDSQPAVGSVRGIVARDEGLVDLNQIALFYANNQADGAQIPRSSIPQCGPRADPGRRGRLPRRPHP